MEDAALIQEIAAEFLRCLGSTTKEYFREKVDRALERSDEVSAEVWRDIAASADKQSRGFQLDKGQGKKLTNIAAFLCSDWIAHGLDHSLESMTSMFSSQLFAPDMVISLSLAASFGG
jgi:hypothetical protein